MLVIWRCLVKRKEALAEGISQYSTGGACRHGHVSPRWTISGSCVACEDMRQRNARAAYRAQRNGEPLRELAIPICHAPMLLRLAEAMDLPEVLAEVKALVDRVAPMAGAEQRFLAPDVAQVLRADPTRLDVPFVVPVPLDPATSAAVAPVELPLAVQVQIALTRAALLQAGAVDELPPEHHR